MRDKIFLDPAKRFADFDFGKEVANAFDDMLARSVPFYFELQNMIADCVSKFLIKESTVYDLGCSTGTTMLMLSKRLQRCKYKMVGIDYSGHMLKKAKTKLDKAHINNYSLKQLDLNQNISFNNMGAAIMILTLQFVRPLNRDALIKSIYNALLNKGCFILVEKVLCKDSDLNRSYLEFYYQLKERNKYSKSEIASKRESLENVLIPYRLEENMELIQRNGFRVVETFFRWFNFVGIIAIKV